MTQPTRLWELSEVIKELENAIAAITDDETLTDEEREAQLEQAFTEEQAENQANRLRRYLLNQMLAAGQTRIDGVLVKLALRKKPPQVMISCDYSELPTDYVNVEYTKLAKIKELLKSEAASGVAWAFMSDSHEYSVTIR
jgi:hypothetical protein